MQNNTNILRNFTVLRDGQLDQEWLDETLAAERSQALRSLARQGIDKTLAYTVATAQRAGMALLDGLDSYISSGSR